MEDVKLFRVINKRARKGLFLLFQQGGKHLFKVSELQLFKLSNQNVAKNS